MPDESRIIIVLPAYNAAKTLEKTYADIPKDRVFRIILVDDVSQDRTVEVARSLGLKVVIHVQNRGYGGNQKTCYLEALKEGADVVVMLRFIMQRAGLVHFRLFNKTLPEVVSKYHHEAIFR